MVTPVDWQTILTVALACLCAAWVLWTALRPFLSRVVNACGLCGACDSLKEEGDPERSHDRSLLRIEPAE